MRCLTHVPAMHVAFGRRANRKVQRKFQRLETSPAGGGWWAHRIFVSIHLLPTARLERRVHLHFCMWLSAANVEGLNLYQAHCRRFLWYRRMKGQQVSLRLAGFGFGWFLGSEFGNAALGPAPDISCRVCNCVCSVQGNPLTHCL